MAGMFPELDFEIPEPSRPPPPKGLSGWVERIARQDMPIFGVTVDGVRKVTDDEAASAARLAQIILQDAGMTAKVLKLANSAFYNSAHNGISTISRAIVVLGFNTVADMALGIALVDSLRAAGVKRRIVEEMARNFHAAVQARSLAVELGDKRAEEIFIAALLSGVGEMAFWSFGEDTAVKLDGEMDAPGADPDEAQQRLLGFRLRQLTLGLVREWRLGALVQAVAEGNPGGDTAGELVLRARALARAVEFGWDSGEARAAVRRLGELVGRQDRELLPTLLRQAEQAARIAASYGATEAARMIPLGDAAALDEKDLVEAKPEPDPLLQLRILRELSGMIAAHAPLNDVLHLAMEGIYRTLGLDRTLFALLAANRTQLVGKAALGHGAERLQKAFVFTVADGRPGDPLRALIEKARPLRLEPRDGLGGAADRLRRVVGEGGLAMVPICAGERAVGMFFVDRARETIDDEAYEGLLHFAQQASLAVTQMAAAGRAR